MTCFMDESFQESPPACGNEPLDRRTGKDCMARQPVTVRIKDMCASFELEGFSITSGRIL